MDYSKLAKIADSVNQVKDSDLVQSFTDEGEFRGSVNSFLKEIWPSPDAGQYGKFILNKDGHTLTMEFNVVEHDSGLSEVGMCHLLEETVDIDGKAGFGSERDVCIEEDGMPDCDSLVEKLMLQSDWEGLDKAIKALGFSHLISDSKKVKDAKSKRRHNIISDAVSEERKRLSDLGKSVMSYIKSAKCFDYRAVSSSAIQSVEKSDATLSIPFKKVDDPAAWLNEHGKEVEELFSIPVTVTVEENNLVIKPSKTKKEREDEKKEASLSPEFKKLREQYKKLREESPKKAAEFVLSVHEQYPDYDDMPEYVEDFLFEFGGCILDEEHPIKLGKITSKEPVKWLQELVAWGEERTEGGPDEIWDDMEPLYIPVYEIELPDGKVVRFHTQCEQDPYDETEYIVYENGKEIASDCHEGSWTPVCRVMEEVYPDIFDDDEFDWDAARDFENSEFVKE